MKTNDWEQRQAEICLPLLASRLATAAFLAFLWANDITELNTQWISTPHEQCETQNISELQWAQVIGSSFNMFQWAQQTYHFNTCEAHARVWEPSWSLNGLPNPFPLTQLWCQRCHMIWCHKSGNQMTAPVRRLRARKNHLKSSASPKRWVLLMFGDEMLLQTSF